MAMLFTALLSAAVLSLGYFIYDFGRDEYERESESAIDAEISNVLLQLQLDNGHSIEDIIDARSRLEQQFHYLLADVNGTRKAGSLLRFPKNVERISEGVIRFELKEAADGADTKRQVAAKIHTFNTGDQMMVVRDIDDISRRFARLRLLSALSIVCMLMVILVSFLISLFVVSRINRMSDTALEIVETGDLSQRLSVDSRWDDLSHLSGAFNEMLDKIEGLVDGVKEVSDNIAHDLRTPLTHLRNRLENLDGVPLSREEVKSLTEEADQILGTFQSLLRISRMDAGGERVTFAPVNIQEVLQDVVELYQPLAEENGLTLLFESSPQGPVHGNRDLIFQAIANVLDNSIKYSTEGDLIFCSLHDIADKGIEVHIRDQGPGISDEEKERVFDRFYRCDASRSTQGNGLGLSMVAAICRLHRGDIKLDDASPKGLLVRILFPGK